MTYAEQRDRLIPQAEAHAIRVVLRVERRGGVQTKQEKDELFDRVFHRRMNELVKEKGI